LLRSAAKFFKDKGSGPSVREARAVAQPSRMKDLIAEITAENVDLKKRSQIGELRPGSRPNRLEQPERREFTCHDCTSGAI